MPGTEAAACRTEAAAAHRSRVRARRRRQHDHRATDPLVLPGLLVVAPVTSRFAFARSRLAQGGWEPAYKLSSGRQWWRCVRLAAGRGELHPCAQRLAQHLSWHLDEQVTLTDVRALLAGYAAYHQLSLRTGWCDWARLVAAGWLAPTRSPANQGPGCPQGPGSGRAAHYVLTIPAALATQLQARSPRPAATSLDTFSHVEGATSPSVSPRRHPASSASWRRGWQLTHRPLTVDQRREASVVLAGCHTGWRRQLPSAKLPARAEWGRLVPLVAAARSVHPGVDLVAVLTDRVAGARRLAEVVAWRLWRLIEQPAEPRPEPVRPEPLCRRLSREPVRPQVARVGAAAARAALAAARPVGPTRPTVVRWQLDADRRSQPGRPRHLTTLPPAAADTSPTPTPPRHVPATPALPAAGRHEP